MLPAVSYVRSFYIMQIGLDSSTGQTCEDPGVRWEREDDLEHIAAIMRDMATVNGHFDEGVHAAIVLRDGAVRACDWFNQGATDHDHWLQLIAPADATCSMFVSMPATERGRGHFARIVGIASREPAREGSKRSVDIVDRLNRNSWTARQRMGGRRTGTIVAIGVAGNSRGCHLT